MRKISGSGFRDGRERKQKETHSEIERKRRDRMKKETEFLQQQLNVNCRDRLSILQQGSKELTDFTNKIGERDYILATQEFNKLILDNLNGFSIVVSCDSGKILHASENVSEHLGYEPIELVDMELIHFTDNASELSSSALETCLQLSELELDNLTKDKAFQRSMILPMRINHHPVVQFSHENCVPSSDGSCEVKFIEFVGNICLENTEKYCEDNNNYIDESLELAIGKPVLRAICRELKVSFSASKLEMDIRTPHFTCRHAPDTLTVKEVVGMPNFLLNIKAEDILGMKPNEFIQPITANEWFQWERIFKTEGATTLYVTVLHRGINRRLRIQIFINAIKISPTIVNCFVAKYMLAEGQAETLLALNRWLEDTTLESQPRRISSSKQSHKPVIFSSQSFEDDGPNSRRSSLLNSGVDGLLDRFKNSLNAQDEEGKPLDSRNSSGSTLKSDKNSHSSLSSGSSGNSIRQMLNLKKSRKPEGDEFPDNGSFKALIAENENMVEELFNLPNLKELVQEDVTDVMQN